MDNSEKFFEVGKSYDIFVTSIKIDEGRLCLCAQGNEATRIEFEHLSQSLQVISSKQDNLQHVEKGLLCSSLCKEDGLWYRAVAEKRLADGKWVVNYIDYGNSEVKSVEELKPLNSDLGELIPQCTNFIIDGDVNPVYTAGLWTDAAVKALNDAFLYTEVTVKVEALLKDRIQAQSDVISRHLVECGLAKLEQFYPVCKYPIGKNTKAYLSHISEHGSVFIQELESANELDKLMDDLNAFYSEKQNQILLPKNMFKAGNIAIAMYSKDNGFYRVQIKDIDGDSCVVHYIDYGDEEQQEIISLFVLDQKFSELEYQAIECFLSNINCGNKFEEKVKKALEVCLETVILDVEVTGCCPNGSPIISVVMKSQDGNNICDSIIAEGLAKLKPDKKEEIKMDYNFLDLELGESYGVLMSNVEEIGTFYVISLQDMEKMNALENSLGHHCFNMNSSPIVDIYKGIPCCAFSHSENKWLRGKVVRSEPQGVLVYFVDYGHTQHCTPASIRVMKPEFLTVPCQAFKCYILKDLDVVEILQLKSLYRKPVVVKTIFNGDSTNSYLVNLVCDGETLFIPKINNNSVYETKRKEYKTLALNKGDTFDLCVVNIKDLNSMVGRVLLNNDNFTRMEKDLECLYNKSIPKCMKMLNFSVGSLCVVQDMKTKQWFRGRINNVIDFDQFGIMLVDYGMTITSLSRNLYRIHDQFLSIPAQVIEFHFHGINPQKLDAATLVQKLELENILINKIFKSTLMEYILESNCSPYSLEIENQDGENINTKINQILRSYSTQVVTCEMLASDCTTLGTFVDVSVCFVENPECIWIQQCSSEKELYQLITEMKSFYGSISTEELTLKDPSLNQMCVVQSGSTEFYRAKVMCTYNSSLEVKLVDYGNDCTVKGGSAKILVPRFFQPKMQAFQCKIDNIKPAGKKWTVDAYKWLCNLLLSQEYRTTGNFVSKLHGTYHIKLKVFANGNIINLADAMVKEGHASYINPPIASNTRNSTLRSDQLNLLKPGKQLLKYKDYGPDMIGLELNVIGCGANSLNEYFLTINDQHLKMKYTSLHKTLASNYAALTSDHSINENSIYRGMPCAVFDQFWCRAAVLDRINLTTVTVCLVDHGRFIEAKIADLKVIDEAIVTTLLPAALRCTTQGLYEPLNNTWSVGALEDFRKFLSSGKLVCTIHGYMADSNGMYMMCSLKSLQSSLEEVIVDCGHGKVIPLKGTLHLPSVSKSFFFSNLDVVKGKEDKFYVTHISDELIYCHLEKNFPVIDKLMDDVQKHCEIDNTSPVNVQELSNSIMCFAKYDDGMWYRAHFIAVLPSQNVKVLFVDYGNIGSVDISNVRKYAGVLSDVHIQVLPCKLLDVDLSSEVMRHPEIVTLLNELLLNKLFSGVAAGSMNGRFNLDLYDNGRRINDFIINVLKQESDLCTSTPITSKDVDSSDLKIENRRLNIEIKDPFFVRVGATRKVRVSNCVNPRNFFLTFEQMADEQLECFDKVDGFYTALRNSDYAVSTRLTPGNIVCGRNEDLTWGRAEVVAVEDNAVQVLYLDTGHMEIIEDFKNIKQLDEDMAKWPKLAVLCALAGVKPKKVDIWSKEAKDFFLNMLNEGGIEARMLHKNVDSTGGIDLWLVELKRNNDSLASLLLEKGLADVIPDECNAFDLTTTNIKSLDVQRITIPTKKFSEKVYISHIESHELIYLQPTNKTQQLDDLMILINEDKSLASVEELPGIGQVCLALYDEDSQFYRSRVVKHSGPNQALVLFVDYGTTSVVSRSNMRMIKVEHTAIPELSFPSVVPHVPSSFTLAQIVSVLEELANDDGLQITAHAEKVQKVDDRFKLDLNIESSGKSRSLFDFFVEKNVENLQPEINDQCIDKGSNKNETCVGLERKLLYQYMTNLMDNPTTEVYISHVETPADIYCQLNDNYILLEELMLEIKTYYKDKNDEDLIKDSTELSTGYSCIAKYSADKAWYRAEVIETIDKENVKVKFVDYGNIESVNYCDIRRSKAAFCELPAQAIHCSLACVLNGKSSWSNDQIDEFNGLVAGKELDVMFVKYENNIYNVMLTMKDGTLLNKKYMGNEAVESVESLPELPCVTVPRMEIQAGETHSAYISYSTTSSNFYVQMEENGLDEIHEKVAINSAEKCELTFKESDFCIAQSSDDMEWYRGKVVQFGDKVKVFFIDYGNSCEVDKDCVKNLSEDSASCYQQAVRCSLKIDDGSLTGNVDKIFANLDLEKLYQVEFVGTDGHVWNVNLLIDGENILKDVTPISVEVEGNNKIKEEIELVGVEKGDGDSCVVETSVSAKQIEAGHIYRCVVSQLNDLNDFYVQFTDYKTLQMLLKNVNPMSGGNKTTSEVFLAKTLQSDWMRIKCVEDDVICIDSGEVFKKEELQFAKMPAEFFSYPSYAVHCQLRNSHGSEIPLDVVRNIEERMQKQLFCVEFVKQVEKCSNKWEVNLLNGNSLLEEVLKESLPSKDHLETPLIVVYNPDEEVGFAFNKHSDSSEGGTVVSPEGQLGIFDKYMLQVSKEAVKTVNNEDNVVESGVHPNPVNCGGVSDVEVLFVVNPDCIFIKLESAKVEDSWILDHVDLAVATAEVNEAVMFKNNDGSFSMGVVLDLTNVNEVKIFDVKTRRTVAMETSVLYDLPTTMKTKPSPIKKCSLFGISPANNTWDQNVIDLLNRYIVGDGIHVSTKFIHCLNKESHVNHWLVSFYLENKSVADILLRSNENVLINAENFEIKQQKESKQGAKRVPFGDLPKPLNPSEDLRKFQVLEEEVLGLPIPVRISSQMSLNSPLQDTVFIEDGTSSGFEIYQSPDIVETNESLPSECEGEIIDCGELPTQQQSLKFQENRGDEVSGGPVRLKKSPLKSPIFVFKSKDQLENLEKFSSSPDKEVLSTSNDDEDLDMSNDLLENQPDKQSESLGALQNKTIPDTTEEDRLPTFVYHETDFPQILCEGSGELEKSNKDTNVMVANTSGEMVANTSGGMVANTSGGMVANTSGEMVANTSSEWQTISVYIHTQPTTTNDESLVADNDTAEMDDGVERSITEEIVLNKNLEDFDKNEYISDADEEDGSKTIVDGDPEVNEQASTEGPGDTIPHVGLLEDVIDDDFLSQECTDGRNEVIIINDDDDVVQNCVGVDTTQDGVYRNCGGSNSAAYSSTDTVSVQSSEDGEFEIGTREDVQGSHDGGLICDGNLVMEEALSSELEETSLSVLQAEDMIMGGFVDSDCNESRHVGENVCANKDSISDGEVENKLPGNEKLMSNEEGNVSGVEVVNTKLITYQLNPVEDLIGTDHCDEEPCNTTCSSAAVNDMSEDNIDSIEVKHATMSNDGVSEASTKSGGNYYQDAMISSGTDIDGGLLVVDDDVSIPEAIQEIEIADADVENNVDAVL